ncbi:MAG: hypothetical protein MUP33_11040 [Polaromonas sp.]|nr:hypothetical protein [Polaromonas sp.]
MITLQRDIAQTVGIAAVLLLMFFIIITTFPNFLKSPVSSQLPVGR